MITQKFRILIQHFSCIWSSNMISTMFSTLFLLHFIHSAMKSTAHWFFRSGRCSSREPNHPNVGRSDFTIEFIDLNILETTVLALNFQFRKIHQNSMTFLYSDICQIFRKSKFENSKFAICSIQEAPKLHLTHSNGTNWIYSDETRVSWNSKIRKKLEISVLNMNNHVS